MFPSSIAGMVWCWSGRLRRGSDPVPGVHDRGRPGPGGGDFEVSAAPAAGQPGCGVQDPVAQGLGLGFGEVAVEGQVTEPGQQGGRGEGRGQPHRVERERL